MRAWRNKGFKSMIWTTKERADGQGQIKSLPLNILQVVFSQWKCVEEVLGFPFRKQFHWIHLGFWRVQSEWFDFYHFFDFVFRYVLKNVVMRSFNCEKVIWINTVNFCWMFRSPSIWLGKTPILGHCSQWKQIETGVSHCFNSFFQRGLAKNPQGRLFLSSGSFPWKTEKSLCKLHLAKVWYILLGEHMVFSWKPTDNSEFSSTVLSIKPVGFAAALSGKFYPTFKDDFMVFCQENFRSADFELFCSDKVEVGYVSEGRFWCDQFLVRDSQCSDNAKNVSVVEISNLYGLIPFHWVKKCKH